MLLIVGLGNPDSKYINTRHNIGFMAIDSLTQHLECSAPKIACQGEITSGRYADEKVLFFKPTTYMNRSGIAVQQVCQFWKIATEDVVVIHDDIDLDFLHTRYKQGGSNAGHNGLKSIDQYMGSNYHRLRLGISRPTTPQPIDAYVLSNFSAAEAPAVSRFLEVLAQQHALIAQREFMTVAHNLNQTQELL